MSLRPATLTCWFDILITVLVSPLHYRTNHNRSDRHRNTILPFPQVASLSTSKSTIRSPILIVSCELGSHTVPPIVATGHTTSALRCHNHVPLDCASPRSSFALVRSALLDTAGQNMITRYGCSANCYDIGHTRANANIRILDSQCSYSLLIHTSGITRRGK